MGKKKIAVISSSVRDGRLSHRVALFMNDFVHSGYGADIDLIDLKEYDFPLFHERLMFMENPPADAVEFAQRFANADGVIVVSPVYNASFPAALKNAVDLLVAEWVKKPVLVVTVTMGGTAAITTMELLQSLFLKLGARIAGPGYNVINAANNFSPEGEPLDRERMERYAKGPVDEFMWLVGASETKSGV